MAEGGRVRKSWRVREAMGDNVPEANTTACACSTTCMHEQLSHVSQTCHFMVRSVPMNQSRGS